MRREGAASRCEQPLPSHPPLPHSDEPEHILPQPHTLRRALLCAATPRRTRAHSVHTQRTPYRPLFTLDSHPFHTTCSPCAHLVPTLCPPCAHLVPILCPPCSHPVHTLFTPCSYQAPLETPARPSGRTSPPGGSCSGAAGTTQPVESGADPLGGNRPIAHRGLPVGTARLCEAQGAASEGWKLLAVPARPP